MSQLKLRNSDHVDRIDGTYIESAIMALWMIDIKNLITNKVHLAKNFHIQPSEIDRMSMWEYEIFIKILSDAVDEENKQQKKELEKYDIDSYKKMSNPSNMNKMMNSQMPKMPDINMNMPKF